MSEMTKKTRYTVRVIVTSNGTVLSSHCECTAGAGNKAKCKHVAVLLFGMEGLSRTGKLTMQKTCTDLPQQWHQPAKIHTGSPAKAKQIQYRTVEEPAQEPAQPGTLTEAAGQGRTKTPGEHDRIMNIIQNFQVSYSW